MIQTPRASKLASQLEGLSRLNAWVSTRDPIRTSIAKHEPAGRPETGSTEWASGRLLAIKDNICTTKEPTTCASGMLRSFYSPFAATVVERLEAAGVVIVGKTNLDEFGMGYVFGRFETSVFTLTIAFSSDSTHSIHGPVQNRYRRDGDLTSAGGSSGGSAVAVATGQCHELVYRSLRQC